MSMPPTDSTPSMAALVLPPLSKVAMSPAPGTVVPPLSPPEDADQYKLLEKEPFAGPIQNLTAASAEEGHTNKAPRKTANNKKCVDLFLSREIKKFFVFTLIAW